MGRPPCCDKVGIKKGPWTPQEDIILVSYIQQHGSCNWRSVPTNTGLLRCSKSCRLRWTNYLKPGIKRGNFTPREEAMIIHLQALLGNKWAAIASYLPQRTDNDIKNYWNTHLKKKLKKMNSDNQLFDSSSPPAHFISKNTFNSSNHFSPTSFPSASTYASSTENISRLLQGWMRSSPMHNKENTLRLNSVAAASAHFHSPKAQQEDHDLISREEFESILSFENVGWNNSNVKVDHEKEINNNNKEEEHDDDDDDEEKKQNPPLTFLEKWLLDESANCEVEESMQLSPIF